MSETNALRSEIATKMSLDSIRYSQVWEDHRLLEEGLFIDGHDDVLSICSAGCNVLALLLCEPRSITAVDMSPAQIALLELKLAAIAELNYEDFISLVGGHTGADPVEIYYEIRGQLAPGTRRFWDSNLDDIRSGITHSGRLEAYMSGFRETYLAKVWPRDLFARLADTESLDEQRELFYAEALSPEFERVFRWYFGREKMEQQGRDPAQFEHVEEGDVGRYFLLRFIYACTQMPVSDNFYLEHVLTGQHADLSIGPPYLRPKNFQRLKGLIDRVHLSVAELEQLLYSTPSGQYSKANLSDIFEYMSPSLSETVFRSLGERMRPGGRIAYWNLLVPRKSPDGLRNLMRPLDELSARLWSEDRSWFYRSFMVEHIQGL